MDSLEILSYAKLALVLVACFLIKRAIELRNKHLQLMHDLKIEELKSIKVSYETYIARQRNLEDKALQIKSECLTSIANLSERMDRLISESESRFTELENKQPLPVKRKVASKSKSKSTDIE